MENEIKRLEERYNFLKDCFELEKGRVVVAESKLEAIVEAVTEELTNPKGDGALELRKVLDENGYYIGGE